MLLLKSFVKEWLIYSHAEKWATVTFWIGSSGCMAGWYKPSDDNVPGKTYSTCWWSVLQNLLEDPDLELFQRPDREYCDRQQALSFLQLQGFSSLLWWAQSTFLGWSSVSNDIPTGRVGQGREIEWYPDVPWCAWTLGSCWWTTWYWSMCSYRCWCTISTSEGIRLFFEVLLIYQEPHWDINNPLWSTCQPVYYPVESAASDPIAFDYPRSRWWATVLKAMQKSSTRRSSCSRSLRHLAKSSSPLIVSHSCVSSCSHVGNTRILCRSTWFMIYYSTLYAQAPCTA